MSANPLFGSYSKTVTPIHRLDTRVKIVCLLAATVAIFAAKQPFALGLIALGIVVLLYCAGIKAKQLAGAVKPTVFILVLSLIFNTFIANGTGDIAIFGSFGISTSGFFRGFTAVARIVMLVALALVLTSTTSSIDIADALTSLMEPLEAVHIPAADIAMTVSVALRFIPLTSEELVRIRDAQRVRGVNFDEGSITERLKKWLSVLTPLVIALFRNADDLAKSMRERCYSGSKRTRFVKQMSSLDWVVVVLFVAICVVLCLL